MAGRYCLDVRSNVGHLHLPIIGYPCHGKGGNQYFLMSKTNEIRRDEMCLDYPGFHNGTVISFMCHGGKGNQEWFYRNDSSIYHPHHQKCMELSVNYKDVYMTACAPNILRQKWSWQLGPV